MHSRLVRVMGPFIIFTAYMKKRVWNKETIMNIVRSVKRICAGAFVVCAMAGVGSAQTPQEEYISALTNGSSS